MTAVRNLVLGALPVLAPRERMANGARYKISVAGGLRSSGGGISPDGRELFFTTAPALEITGIYPRPNDPSVWLSRQITVRANQELGSAKIEVEGMPGEVSFTGGTATFKPRYLFMPARKYRVAIKLSSLYGEQVTKEFWFGATDLGNQRWVGIKLGNTCEVSVFEGNSPLAACQGWLTISGEKVPRVTMYEVKRGSTAGANPRDPSPARYIALNALWLQCPSRNLRRETW